MGQSEFEIKPVSRVKHFKTLYKEELIKLK
jgi:hypothetical protein